MTHPSSGQPRNIRLLHCTRDALLELGPTTKPNKNIDLPEIIFNSIEQMHDAIERGNIMICTGTACDLDMKESTFEHFQGMMNGIFAHV